MEYILKVLTKIKWDKRLDQKEFSVVYTDRISDRYTEIPYLSIKRIEGSFMVIEGIDEEIFIPLHRIHGVKQKDKIIWNR